MGETPDREGIHRLCNAVVELDLHIPVPIQIFINNSKSISMLHSALRLHCLKCNEI